MKSLNPHEPLATAVVVNDDVTQLNFLTALLHKEGIDALPFLDAEVALKAMIQNRPPDIIVTDLYMPGLDGWRFCRLLRSPEYQAFNRTPILVISATFAGEEAARITTDLGADAFLTSPIDAGRFIEHVHTLLGGERSQHQLRVLIVEDSKTLTGILRRAFDANGYWTETALTVSAAIATFGKSDWDVAVIDYHLPDGQGDSLLHDFRAKQPDCVCIMMTTDPAPELALDWMKKGAAAYLRKPFAPEYLIELCVKTRRERALLRVQDLLEMRTQELQESEKNFRTFFDTVDDIILVCSPDSKVIYSNPAVSTRLGYSRDELKGMHMLDLHPADKRKEAEAIATAMFKGERKSCPLPLQSRSGALVPVETRVWFGKWNGVDCIFGVSKDLTREQESLQKFNRFFNSNPAPMAVSSLQERIFTEVNDAFLSTLGYSRQEVIGKTAKELDLFNNTEKLQKIAEQLQAHGSLANCELEVKCKDGTIIDGLFSCEIIENQGQKSILTVMIDQTERKRAEETVRESEDRLRLLSDNLPNGMVYQLVIEPDGRRYFRHISAGIEQNHGLTVDDVLRDPMALYNQYIQEDRSRLEEAEYQANKSMTVFNIEARYRTPEGNVRWAHLRSTPRQLPGGATLWDGFEIDITSRKHAEAEKAILENQNRQLQKAESLGRMAGAIAHYFNNQLGAVIGNLELAMMDLPQGGRPHAKVTAAMIASNRSAEMSGLMLTYLGQSFDKREPLDLSDACRRSLTMLQAIMPGNVVLDIDFPSLGPVIMANVTQIQQVLANLATNAWESIGESRGTVHLRIKTVSTVNITAVQRFPLDWQPMYNSYACIEVTDAGGGIDDSEIEKIFDPFFTSNATGRGMGLAVVLGIVRAHSGVITVESELDRGSSFRVFFPISGEEVLRQPEKVGDAKDILISAVSPIEMEGGGTILLVEDEEMVREVAAAMLKRLGYSVLEAKDGVEALEVFRQHQSEIRCVLSDLTMPRMNGWETLTALRKLAPDIPVILASGYDKAQVMAGDHPELPQAFLGKPYKLKGLSDAISQALVSRK